MAGVVLAIVWANVNHESYHHFVHARLLGPLSVHFLTNDMFMVFFFAIATVEITQSFLPGGDLSPPKKGVNPLLATIGGVLGPAAVYLLLNRYIGFPELVNGWGIPTATDIALAWLAARIVFGNNHPVIAFLLLLAIADDAIGLAIIAIFYPDPLIPVAPPWLLLTGAGMAAAYILRRFGCRNYRPYILFGGMLAWTGLYKAHLHPALALVFIIPFLPHATKEKKHMFEEDLADKSPLSQFEHEWKVIVDFGLFMFGLINAGVQFNGVGTATWLVLSSLLLGKTIGIFSFGYLGVKLGFPLPSGMKFRELLLAGIIAGIGFTVALFVAGEAFTDPVIQGAAKMGALLSLFVSLFAVILGRALKIKRIP